MKVEDFDLLSRMLYQRSGLVLTKEKAYLLESRLMPIARRWNMPDALYRHGSYENGRRPALYPRHFCTIGGDSCCRIGSSAGDSVYTGTA